MNQDEAKEFQEMLVNESLEVELTRKRFVPEIYQFLVFASTIGLFSGLWKVIEFWINHREITSVKISYTSETGKDLEITYSKLTMEDARKIIEEHPPSHLNPAKVEIEKGT